MTETTTTRQPDPAFVADVDATLAEIRDMLIEKNTAYGNAALDPIRIFSRADAIEQINVRIDDKLSRICNGVADREDPELDLLGYLTLLRIAKGRGKL